MRRLSIAAVAEYGSQYYGLKADPQSLDGTYYGLHNTSAVSSRDHFGFGAEVSVPVFSTLTATGATRFDSYKYSSTTSGKVTYSVGLKYRPIHSLLLRGSYGTGFRAPDLTYLYSGLSGSSSGGTDYYLCRLNEPNTAPDFVDNCTNGNIGFNGRSHGSTALKDETSKSITYGLVFAPVKGLEITADFYLIKLKNEVLYEDSDRIPRAEADCRLGQTPNGTAVDINSNVCQAILNQVVRNPSTDPSNPNGITSVMVLPINAAIDKTSGIDFSAHYGLGKERFGTFDFNVGITDVLTHTIQQFEGDTGINEFDDWYDYVIPRYKASYSVGWGKDSFTATVHGSHLGGLSNYKGDTRLGSTSVYNASANYRIGPHMALTLVVDNLFDTKPGKDHTWTSYPYYASRWFSPVGRAFFAQFNYRMGGRIGN